MTDSDKLKRRWYQFSLRTLLVLVLLVSLPLSWLGVKMNQARRQKEAVEAVVKAGGRVIYDYEITADGADLSGATAPSAPAWIRKSLGDDLFRNVVWVVSTSPAFGDAELEHVGRLPKLEGLRLVATPVTDAGLEHLKGLTNLEQLNLFGTPITGVGLEHLKGLTRLETLSLSATKVTDAGLEHLKGLANLKYLFLNDTQVTDEGAKEIQEALPNCEVRYQPPSPKNQALPNCEITY